MPTTIALSRLTIVGVLAATAACSRGSDTATNPSATVATTDVEVAPPVTSALSPPITDASTTIAVTAATTAATSAPPETTVATSPDPCAEFRAFGAYGRMLAVEGGTAPTDPACADDVANAEAAVRVFRTTDRTFPDRYEDELVKFAIDNACDDAGGHVRFQNNFDQAVIWWGAGYVADEAEVITAFYPFFTVVSPPGETVAITAPDGFPSPRGGYCGWKFDAILAPIGDNAPDAGLIPAPADDLQASDDPSVWFPDLMDYGEPNQASMVNEIEDIHSPDVVLHPSDQADADSSTTDDEAVTTFCQEVPVAQPGGTQGQLTLILYSTSYPGADPRQTIQLGLFRRGSDKRWRFAGTVQTVYEFPEPKPDAPCEFPLYPLRDLNAPSG